ncbi:MAG: hypothetical protein QF922_01655, partial [SAR324 cluster bacterium]|nr:hypothetical protein [SAR324 cluster bacterium]
MGDETGWFKFPVFAKSRCSDSLCVSGLHAVTRKIMKLTELINHGFQNIFTSKKSRLKSNLLIVENSDGFFLPENNARIFARPNGSTAFSLLVAGRVVLHHKEISA